ncbi:hypothetical protein BC829DRAFT_420596, partial [Chytridium lagenaria]
GFPYCPQNVLEYLKTEARSDAKVNFLTFEDCHRLGISLLQSAPPTQAEPIDSNVPPPPSPPASRKDSVSSYLGSRSSTPRVEPAKPPTPPNYFGRRPLPDSASEQIKEIEQLTKSLSTLRVAPVDLPPIVELKRTQELRLHALEELHARRSDTRQFLYNQLCKNITRLIGAGQGHLVPPRPLKEFTDKSLIASATKYQKAIFDHLQTLIKPPVETSQSSSDPTPSTITLDSPVAVDEVDISDNSSQTAPSTVSTSSKRSRRPVQLSLDTTASVYYIMFRSEATVQPQETIVTSLLVDVVFYILPDGSLEFHNRKYSPSDFNLGIHMPRRGASAALDSYLNRFSALIYDEDAVRRSMGSSYVAIAPDIPFKGRQINILHYLSFTNLYVEDGDGFRILANASLTSSLVQEPVQETVESSINDETPPEGIDDALSPSIAAESPHIGVVGHPDSPRINESNADETSTEALIATPIDHLADRYPSLTPSPAPSINPPVLSETPRRHFLENELVAFESSSNATPFQQYYDATEASLLHESVSSPEADHIVSYQDYVSSPLDPVNTTVNISTVEGTTNSLNIRHTSNTLRDVISFPLPQHVERQYPTLQTTMADDAFLSGLFNRGTSSSNPASFGGRGTRPSISRSMPAPVSGATSGFRINSLEDPPSPPPATDPAAPIVPPPVPPVAASAPPSGPGHLPSPLVSSDPLSLELRSLCLLEPLTSLSPLPWDHLITDGYTAKTAQEKVSRLKFSGTSDHEALQFLSEFEAILTPFVATADFPIRPFSSLDAAYQATWEPSILKTWKEFAALIRGHFASTTDDASIQARIDRFTWSPSAMTPSLALAQLQNINALLPFSAKYNDASLKDRLVKSCLDLPWAATAKATSYHGLAWTDPQLTALDLQPYAYLFGLHTSGSGTTSSNDIQTLAARSDRLEQLVLDMNKSLKSFQRQNRPLPRQNLLSFAVEDVGLTPPTYDMSSTLVDRFVTLTVQAASKDAADNGHDGPTDLDVVNFQAQVEAIRRGDQPYRSGYPRNQPQHGNQNYDRPGPSHGGYSQRPPYQSRPPQWCPFHNENHWSDCPFNTLTKEDLEALLSSKGKKLAP